MTFYEALLNRAKNLTHLAFCIDNAKFDGKPFDSYSPSAIDEVLLVTGDLDVLKERCQKLLEKMEKNEEKKAYMEVCALITEKFGYSYEYIDENIGWMFGDKNQEIGRLERLLRHIEIVKEFLKEYDSYKIRFFEKELRMKRERMKIDEKMVANLEAEILKLKGEAQQNAIEAI